MTSAAVEMLNADLDRAIQDRVKIQNGNDVKNFNVKAAVLTYYSSVFSEVSLLYHLTASCKKHLDSGAPENKVFPLLLAWIQRGLTSETNSEVLSFIKANLSDKCYEIANEASNITTIRPKLQLSHQGPLRRIKWIKEAKAVTLAKAITAVEWRRYCRLKAEDILSELFTRKKSKNLSAFIDQSENLMLWTVESILLPNKHEDRVALLVKFIDIMMNLFNLNNFNSALTVYLAVNHDCVKRLGSLRKRLSKESNHHLRSMDLLFSPLAKYSTYHQHISKQAKQKKAAIPRLTLVLEDLVELEKKVATPSLIADTTSKNLQLGALVNDALIFQNFSFTHVPDQDTYHYFKHSIKSVDTDDLNARSNDLLSPRRKAPKGDDSGQSWRARRKRSRSSKPRKSRHDLRLSKSKSDNQSAQSAPVLTGDEKLNQNPKFRRRSRSLSPSSLPFLADETAEQREKLGGPRRRRSRSASPNRSPRAAAQDWHIGTRKAEQKTELEPFLKRTPRTPRKVDS